MPFSRRDFLSLLSLSGAGVAAGDLPGVREALAHADAVRRGTQPARFETLTQSEAAEVAAIAARIMPTTDTPGATEAGVVYFIDKAFRGFAAPQLEMFRAGLADLAKRVAGRHAGVSTFAALSAGAQDALLTDIEQTPFFGSVRSLVLIGMFADPVHGGNRGQVGWKLIGFENRMTHTPPFGYYDAQLTGGRD